MAGTSPAMTKSESFSGGWKEPENAGRFFGHTLRPLLLSPASTRLFLADQRRITLLFEVVIAEPVGIEVSGAFVSKSLIPPAARLARPFK
jgi:hypothetical protein